MAKFRVEENYPLASLTTFNLGGPARYYVSVRTEAGFLEALNFAKSRDIPIFILGGGSNILVSDRGFDGLVIRNGIRGVTNRTDGGSAFVHVGAGEDWQEFVDWCISENLQGVECLAGIPGTVGAAPVQNIGAYGQDVSETIFEIKAIEVDTGKPVLFKNEVCGFGYRASIFNSTSDGRYCITGVTLKLKKNGKPPITHPDLANRLKEARKFTIRHVRDSIIDIRGGKGLLVRKGHERFRCAGSFFKNPVLPAERAREIEEGLQSPGAYRSWPLGIGEVKIAAAGLIEGAGFRPGYRKGNVGLSPKHALVVIAHSGATAQEVIEFTEEIQEKVKEKFDILLRPEIRLVGFAHSCQGGRLLSSAIFDLPDKDASPQRSKALRPLPPV
jgi:UDP-N-acetylmuramate dehydrogenase